MKKIIVVDINPSEIDDARVSQIILDLRETIPADRIIKNIPHDSRVLIYNLAAICRIPGFPVEDYFEVNVYGAETICEFADKIDCKDLVFVSSMSVYGTSEVEKTEDSLPLPDNPYGISKAIAEKIHIGWYKSKTGRNLHILRPGIIFGKGENANFTRLYSALAKRYFVYPGRKDTRKAAIYVKDVAECCEHFGRTEKGLNIYNLVYPEAPTIESICLTIAKITGVSKPLFVVPPWLLILSSNLINLISIIIGLKDSNFHPDRVRKLMISTNVTGRKLEAKPYKLSFPLEAAVQDWYDDSDKQGLQ